MPEQNGQSDPPSPTDLDTLESKLAAAHMRRDLRQGRKEKAQDNSLLGMAWRLSTELLASVLVGMFLGWGIDTVFGTEPWGFLIGLGLGMAAGFMSVFRTAAAMDAKTAHIPKGDDLREPGYPGDGDED
ncbi:AtpZ/AtpI family protein [uncultured Algimonas sp.]|uniref:AtpZ/AtpI family protein n=1 Tax=uncultured Algimonas sp. TaxID=1547920 RepID=UPI002629D4AC|nr:AtpZ/AtpI family protein [uncultured Algimonas sp.]